jgi:uncharacterized membrane protein YgcG
VPDRVYLAVENGDLQPAELGNARAYACGLPAEFSGGNLNEDLAPGFYIARNCRIDLEGLDDTVGVQPGGWNIRATRGTGDTLAYTGRIESSAPIVVRERGNLNEDHDTLEVSEAAIDFRFEVRGGQDGVDFFPEFGQNTCITIDVPEGAQIYYGPLKRPVTGNEFYLDTLEPCPGGTPEPPPPPPADPGDDDDDGNGGDGDGNGNGGDGDGNGDGGGSPIAGGDGGGGGSLNPVALLGLLALAGIRRRMSGIAKLRG